MRRSGELQRYGALITTMMCSDSRQGKEEERGASRAGPTSGAGELPIIGILLTNFAMR